MHKRIEIKPEDQSFVGQKIRWSTWDMDEWVILRYVGKKCVFAEASSGKDDCREDWWNISDKSNAYWELYEEPKKYEIVSPAVIGEQSYQITTQVYETEQKARLEWPTSFHSWPALDANGNPIQYRVEVKE